MAILQRITRSLAQQGLVATLAKLHGLFLDYWFDFRYGLDTCACSTLDDLTVCGENKAGGYQYSPTRVLPLRRLFVKLLPRLAEEFVLVDFGSGKGRILLVAAEYGFREVRGVEFARELSEIARKNCARFKARTGVATQFKIIEGDAARYVVQPDENVFVMCNPFNDAVLSGVLAQISTSLRSHPRNVMIIYYNPKWAQVIEQWGECPHRQELVSAGFRFAIYSNAPDTAVAETKNH